MIAEKKRSLVRYGGFTLVEMLLTMAILSALFLAIGGLLQNMIKSSEYASSRMLMREEGEFLGEIFRKYLRNSSVDNVALYYREDPVVEFSDDYEIERLSSSDIILDLRDPENPLPHPATEIHFRPSGDSTGRVICIGFFRDQGGKGRIIKSSGYFDGGWTDLGGFEQYDPEECFPTSPTPLFRKEAFILSSDLVHMDSLGIQAHMANLNIYYVIDIDMKPAWGWKALTKSLDDDKVKLRKSIFVETRQLSNW